MVAECRCSGKSTYRAVGRRDLSQTVAEWKPDLLKQAVLPGACFETVARRDAGAKPTGTYSRRVSEQAPGNAACHPLSLPLPAATKASRLSMIPAHVTSDSNRTHARRIAGHHSDCPADCRMFQRTGTGPAARPDNGHYLDGAPCRCRRDGAVRDCSRCSRRAWMNSTEHLSHYDPESEVSAFNQQTDTALVPHISRSGNGYRTGLARQRSQ